MTGPSLDILLAEDSPTQAELIRHALEKHGHRVRIARNGLVALELAREAPPSLVVTDVMMPGLDGYGLCRALKEDPSTRAVPVVLLTTLTDPADILRGIECGADNFVGKPFSAEILLERIDSFLQNGELSRSQIFDLLLSAFDELTREHERLKQEYGDLARRHEGLAQGQRDLESARAGAGNDAIRICAKCKRMQDDLGDWVPVEEYLRRALGLAFTHDFCDDCGDGLLGKPAAP